VVVLPGIFDGGISESEADGPTYVFVHRLGRGPDDPTSNRGQPDRDRRTWFRLLFESQLAAYEPNAEGQAAQGWYYWTCESGDRERSYSSTPGSGKADDRESV